MLEKVMYSSASFLSSLFLSITQILPKAAFFSDRSFQTIGCVLVAGVSRSRAREIILIIFQLSPCLEKKNWDFKDGACSWEHFRFVKHSQSVSTMAC